MVAVGGFEAAAATEIAKPSQSRLPPPVHAWEPVMVEFVPPPYPWLTHEAMLGVNPDVVKLVTNELPKPLGVEGTVKVGATALFDTPPTQMISSLAADVPALRAILAGDAPAAPPVVPTPKVNGVLVLRPLKTKICEAIQLLLFEVNV